ncbi:MAG: MoaD/ThiS family protein [Dehalococcoidia bacterium]
MKINLNYHKLLGKYINTEKYPSDSSIEVPANCTVNDLIVLLGIPKDRQKSIVVHVNNEPTWNTTRLSENDSVKLVTAIGGG